MVAALLWQRAICLVIRWLLGGSAPFLSTFSITHPSAGQLCHQLCPFLEILNLCQLMAELYILGQLIGAREFSDKSIFCKWKLIAGKWQF